MLISMFANPAQTLILAVGGIVFYAAIGALVGLVVYMVRKRNRPS
jgi:hypothetical protein